MKPAIAGAANELPAGPDRVAEFRKAKWDSPDRSDAAGGTLGVFEQPKRPIVFRTDGVG